MHKLNQASPEKQAKESNSIRGSVRSFDNNQAKYVGTFRPLSTHLYPMPGGQLQSPLPIRPLDDNNFSPDIFAKTRTFENGFSFKNNLKADDQLRRGNSRNKGSKKYNTGNW